MAINKGRDAPYRPDQPIAELDAPPTLSGEPELSGFALDLGMIWDLDF